MLPLLGSVVAGGLIGIEREAQGKPAGLRTHMLVCFTSALMTLAALQMEWLDSKYIARSMQSCGLCRCRPEQPDKAMSAQRAAAGHRPEFGNVIIACPVRRFVRLVGRCYQRLRQGINTAAEGIGPCQAGCKRARAGLRLPP